MLGCPGTALSRISRPLSPVVGQLHPAWLLALAGMSDLSGYFYQTSILAPVTSLFLFHIKVGQVRQPSHPQYSWGLQLSGLLA